MNLAHARVTGGRIFKACDAYWATKSKADEQVNALVIEFGCVPGRTLRWGARLEGLYLAAGAPKPGGWSPAGKAHPGYVKPNKRTLAGRAAAAKLEAVKLPTDEDLAHLLGFPPFFTEPGGGSYCSAAGCFMRGGVYYLEFPAVLSRYLNNDGKADVEFIKEWEYLKAQDEA